MFLKEYVSAIQMVIDRAGANIEYLAGFFITFVFQFAKDKYLLLLWWQQVKRLLKFSLVFLAEDMLFDMVVRNLC